MINNTGKVFWLGIIGTMTYKNGDIYTGEFDGELMNGKGIYKYKDRHIQFCKW